MQASQASIHWLYTSIASSRGAMSQRYELLQTLQETAPLSFSMSSVAVTVFMELQKGQLKVASSFGFCFFGGGFEDLRFPMSFHGSQTPAAAAAVSLCTQQPYGLATQAHITKGPRLSPWLTLAPCSRSGRYTADSCGSHSLGEA